MDLNEAAGDQTNVEFLGQIKDPEMAERLGKLMEAFTLAAEETDIHNLE